MTVSDLLTQSHRAHHEAKRAAHDGQHSKCRELRQIALNARMDAHYLDPAHTNPAWQAEQAKTPQGSDTHDELMRFYAERGLTYQGVIPEPAPAPPQSPSLQAQLDAARAEIDRLLQSQELGANMAPCQPVETAKA